MIPPQDYEPPPFASDAASRRNQEDLRFAVDAARLGTFYCDYPLDKIVWNDTCKEHFFLAPDAEVDFSLFYSLLHPDDREPTRQAIEKAMEGRVAYDVEYRTLAPDGRTRWVNAVGRFYYDPDGNPTRFDGITLDISARRQAEYRLRRLFDSQVVGVIFWNLDTGLITDANARFLSMVGYTREDLVAGLLDFRKMTPPEWQERNEQGVATIRAAGSAPTYEKEYYRKDGSRVPILIGGTRFEESGAEGFSYILDITERKHLEIEQERLLGEARARAERETLVSRVVQAVLDSPDPEFAQREAVSLLGAALGADRCYVAIYDLDRNTVRVTEDWHRAGLAPIQGAYAFPNTAEMYQELYHGTNTSVIADAHAAALSAQTRANMERLGLRSRISVSLVDDRGFIATLTAAMTHEPRAWTGEETALVEAVAPQLRTAVERARIAQREHRIAEQLQAALLPAVPSRVPGLRLAHYYRAALQEAGIGGDFAQVFSDDKGVTYLIVGDLAGKGLAAAGQIGVVTNMLRFAVHNGHTLAGPLTSLNATLADGGLLSGFATLFVGRYDADDGMLTYVNCGQDAGLILRADTGRVELLPPTGPILGAFGGALYTEETVTLKAGDVLALYTDGLSEAGPTRAALLTGDGVADLLRDLTGIADPQEIVSRVIAGVDTYAGQGIRDDQCLLVGVVSD